MNGTIENWALHAYADGELEGHEMAEVESRLATDLEARKLLEAIRQEKAALKRAYDGVLDEAVPPALLAAVQRQAPRRSLPWASLAAGIALLGLGAVSGWLGAHYSGQSQVAAMSERALAAHAIYSVEVRHPVEVAAADSDHLKAWLAKRVGVPVSIPDLSARGLTFIGGRLLASEAGAAGQLMYEDAGKNRVAIYLTPNRDHRESSIHMVKEKDIWACSWLAGPTGFVVTGDMPREQMVTLANDIYAQLDEG